MADIIFDYKIKKTAEIFENDSNFKKLLILKNVYIYDTGFDENSQRMLFFESLSKLLLSNYEYISNRSIDELWSLNFLVNELSVMFVYSGVVDEYFYRTLMYTFKYSTIKHFFINNYLNFLPFPDAEAISGSEKVKVFQDSLMKEFDKLTDIIDKVYDIVDVDKVDNEYLSYLVQLLGYEKGDDKGMLANDSFRQLAKNIIEVYRIKGTNYSFELFFNFLGFEIEINEFWFDKRYKNPGISENPYTKVSNPNLFSFYLTPVKPTEGIPAGMINPYSVSDDKLTDIRSHLWFELKLKNGESLNKLLGEDPEDPPDKNFDFTFFKTNIVQYNVKRIKTKETDSDGFSEDDERIIQSYADFLTPIFMVKQLSVSSTPFEDPADSLYFLDDSYNLPDGSVIKIWNNEMLEHPKDTWNDEFEEDLSINNIYLWFKGIDDVLSTIQDLDYMTKVNGSEKEFSSGKFVKVSNINKGYPSLWNWLANDERERLSLNFPISDESTSILNFTESLYSKIFRLEELNIYNRDYLDWDDFSKLQEMPTLISSGEQLLSIDTFHRETDGEETIYTMNDDQVYDIPWLYYDQMKIVKS